MQDRYLRTGIFLAPFHPLHENPTLYLERDMQLVKLLDRLNFHEGWIGKHHSRDYEIISCPEIVHSGGGLQDAQHPTWHRCRLAAGVVVSTEATAVSPEGRSVTGAAASATMNR